MRIVCSLLLVAGCVSLGSAQDVKFVKRYNINQSDNDFPQKTAKDCLESIIKAIETRKIDYLLAHLADPDFVDERVKKLEGGFPDVVKEATVKLADDPGVIKELKKFARDGEWENADEAASVRLKDNKSRAIFLKKVKERWYMENRQKGKEPPPKEKE